MNAQSYIDIAKRIRLKVPAIKAIDIFNNQYEEPERHASLNCPCVFVEWLPTLWQDTGQGIQEGKGGFRIHCVMKTYRGTVDIDKVSDAQAALNLGHLTLPADIHAALQGFEPECYTKLTRTQTIPDHRYNSIIAIVHEYTAEELDGSAYEYKDYVDHTIEDFVVPGEIKKAGEE
jgi:hypothetical protein